LYKHSSFFAFLPPEPSPFSITVTTSPVTEKKQEKTNNNKTDHNKSELKNKKEERQFDCPASFFRSNCSHTADTPPAFHCHIVSMPISFVENET
jgi:hypothetical protein